MMIPPSGWYPEVTPLAKEITSGTTFHWSSPQNVPVRPKPVMTSSAIRMMSWWSQRARRRGK